MRGRVSPELGSGFELSLIFFGSLEVAGASDVAFGCDVDFRGLDLGTLMITGSKIDLEDIGASDFFITVEDESVVVAGLSGGSFFAVSVAGGSDGFAVV